ncbi:hypothetical protein [Xylocopilactobacillus apicola]|uniref:Uncharacterized protein n=1 Tax=Xylocopilactobacillus apicola TaxID=2932184 RepID=A0AAU9DVJ7_9LACO|nr:hypothetical protein [Xylocopilactobacillus apicola]BDR59498.1 hypothetical protein XA3_19390 [Xylocopilactobacillus apicola]
MDSEKMLAKLIEEAEKLGPKDLLNLSMDDPDPDKRQLYDALYTYVLDKRQKEWLKRERFVI